MSHVFTNLPQGVQGELYNHRSNSVQVKFNNSQFEDIINSSNDNSTLRVIKDGKMSVASSSQPNTEALLVANALETAKFGSAVRFDLPGAAQLPTIPLVDERTTQLDVRTMVDIADDLTQSLLNYDSRIRVSSGAGHEEQEVTLTNSAGFSGTYRKTIFTVGLGGQLIQGDDFLRFGEYRSSVGTDIDYEELKKDIIRQFEWAKNVVPFAPGSYPVIFAPLQVSFLMTPFAACLNGKAFARGISPWKDYMGQQILDQRVTVVDDGTLPNMVSSAPFDREGIPTRRNVLIDQGVPQQLLLDLQTAKELGKESTGNGTINGPSIHRVLLSPGTASFDQLLKKIDTGLLILGSMGAWTGNPFSGNVSGTISLGLKVEKGGIVGRVKDCMFSINSFTHFRQHIIDFSSETKEVGGAGPGGGSATFPYVALDEVVIATK